MLLLYIKEYTCGEVALIFANLVRNSFVMGINDTCRIKANQRNKIYNA